MLAVLVTTACQIGAAPASPSSTSTPSPSLAADVCHVGGQTLCVLNPAVTPTTIKTTICVVGWTATIRPPSNYTSQLKAQQMAAEHLSGNAADYEEDHRLSLELGGAPSDPFNLSPESHSSSFIKDADENRAKARVCAGADLRYVQAEFIQTWLEVWPTYKR